jgi:oxygen-independent coproporphyrinogen-3 oxidase
MDKLGLYIHIPFCLQKCRYCDFASYAGLEHLYSDYADALCREMVLRSGGFSDAVVDTVYLGGGTPSVLPLKLLDNILKTASDYFHIETNAEVTLEVNPGSVNDEKLMYFKTLGINRLSFGVQTFDDALLQTLGRIHTSSDSINILETAGNAGFTNINIDLMHGLPGQSLEKLSYSLKTAAAIGAGHISVYGLKIEENTPFAQMAQQGILSLPDAELEETMYDSTIDYLIASGYERYEISSFAKPGFKSRHNLRYWQNSPYLGFGAAAHSFAGGIRSFNAADVGEYIKKITANDFSVQMYEKTDCREKMAEFIFLALRTSDGLYYQQFNNYFGIDFLKEYGGIVETLAAMGLVEKNGCRIFLTRKGMKFGNQVFQKFLPD